MVLKVLMVISPSCALGSPPGFIDVRFGTTLLSIIANLKMKRAVFAVDLVVLEENVRDGKSSGSVE